MARVAGVSRATVSYVLNDRRDVKITEVVRQRVLAVAHELGYQPSPAGRALQAGRGDVVLLLVPGWETTGEVGRFLAEIGRLVSDGGLVCLRYEGAHWRGELGRLLTMVTAAAVVTFEQLGADDAKALANAGIPEVKAFLLDQPSYPHTTHIEQADVVSAQVDHLRERGFSRLAYLATEAPRDEAFQAARVASFRIICADLGIDGTLAVVADELTAVTEAVRGWLRRSPERLGICAWNDHTAIGILTSARILGVEVPRQLGVIGCDDSPTARLVNPSLSSVHFDLTQEAASVANQIKRATRLNAEDSDAPRRWVKAVSRHSS